MCIAILNTSKQLPDSYIKNSWDNNNQGAGLLWQHEGKIHTFKTFSYKDFLKEYKRVRKLTKGKVVLHFRIATSGYKGLENLHPFLVNKDLGFVHNGVIHGLGNDTHSDTYQFNDMLRELPEGFLNNSTITELISSYIENSKLVFLSSDNTHTIINERLGHWVEDDWFSNTSYQSYNDYVWAGNKKVSRTSTLNEKTQDDDFYGDIYGQSVMQMTLNDVVDEVRMYFDDVSEGEVIKFMQLTGCSLDYVIWEIENWSESFETTSLADVNMKIEEYNDNNI